MNRFSLFVSWRYLNSGKGIRLSFINILNLAGIVLGVFALLSVVSVMNGFDSNIRDKILALRSEIKVKKKGDFTNFEAILAELREKEYVKSAVPIIENELILQSDTGIAGTRCFAIEPVSYINSTELRENIITGKMEPEEFNKSGIILGIDLAVQLGVTAGEYVQLSSALGTQQTPLGLLPRSRRLRVVALFSSGIPEYDRHICYTGLSLGQYFSGIGKAVDYIEVRSSYSMHSYRYRELLKKELGEDFIIEDWSEYESNLFNAIRLEKALMVLVLMLIILLAGFNIAGNINRMVTSRKRDIGILRAWGVKKNLIQRIFMQTGLYLGGAGIIIGMICAWGFCFAQMRWEFIKIPVAGFPLDSVPVEMRTGDFVLIPLTALMIVFLSTLFPAQKAKKESVIEIIQEGR